MRRLLPVLVAVVLTAACTTRIAPPDLGGLYSRAAQHHGPDRNPIVVMPGLTGSTLVDSTSGRIVWGAFSGDYARPTRPEDLRLIALPMREGASLGELRDDVYPAGVLDRARQLHLALDQPAPPPPPNLDIYLAAGDAAETPRTVAVEPSNGRLRVVSRAPGDGTVLRTSALLDERQGGPWEPTLRSPIPWNEVLFLFTDHLGLTRDPGFTDNILFWLLEKPRPPAS